MKVARPEESMYSTALKSTSRHGGLFAHAALQFRAKLGRSMQIYLPRHLEGSDVVFTGLFNLHGSEIAALAPCGKPFRGALLCQWLKSLK